MQTPGDSHKYPNLKDIRYYEGIAKGDTKKHRTFNFLAHKGYTICPLERIILVTCDGDYAEAIRNAVNLNPNVSVAVLATPSVKQPDRNTLSTKLKDLLKEIPRYRLHNINSIRKTIKSSRPTDKNPQQK